MLKKWLITYVCVGNKILKLVINTTKNFVVQNPPLYFKKYIFMKLKEKIL